MRPLRAIGLNLRILLALLVALMSLAHGPVMAFGQDRAAHSHHETITPAADHQHHHLMHSPIAEQPGAEMGSPASICYASGCFVGIAPLPAPAPARFLTFAERLTPAATEAVRSAEPAPSVPPPRLRI